MRFIRGANKWCFSLNGPISISECSHGKHIDWDWHFSWNLTGYYLSPVLSSTAYKQDISFLFFSMWKITSRPRPMVQQ